MDAKRQVMACALAATFGLGLVACGTPNDNDNDMTTAADTARPTDEQVETNVQARFFGDDTIKAERIDVDAANGVVTLSGTVPTAEARDRATRLAADVNGVDRVDNRLEVAGATTMAQAESDTNPGWITTKIRAQYFLDPDVKGRDIDVTTSTSGQVMLTGEVESATERQAALRIARETEGVTGVEDHLAMAGEAPAGAAAPQGQAPAAEAARDERGLDMGDAWITAKVQARYFMDSDVKGRDIDVDTVNGVVTLNGTVETAAEKRQAVALAEMTDGVTSVNDRLTVSPAPRPADEAASSDQPVTDVWISTKIRSAFFLDDEVKGRDLDVSTKDGVVTLTGEVQTTQEKTAAETIAREIRGVDRVVNRIVVNSSK